MKIKLTVVNNGFCKTCKIGPRPGKTSGHDRETSGEVVEIEKGPKQTVDIDEILRERVEVSVLFLQFHLWNYHIVEQAVALGHQ